MSFSIPEESEEEEEVVAAPPPKKQKKETPVAQEKKAKPSTPAASAPSSSAGTPGTPNPWSKEEEAKFKKALAANPEGTDRRWEKVAAAVGTRSKDQCKKKFASDKKK